MSAKVSTSGVSIGTGEDHAWRGVTSPRPVQPREDCVKIYLGISHVRGGRATVSLALENLRQQGVIERYQLGALGSTPSVLCEPGVDVVRAIHASGTADNEFVTAFLDKLQKLLDDIGGVEA